MGDPRRLESGLIVEDRGHVRVLTLDRPERRNALSTALQADLVERFLTCVADGVRAVVLTGNGPAFCAGFDLKEIRAADERGERFRPPMNRSARNVFEVVTETSVPVVAALNGAAVAGGFELALACDIRVAAPGIKLGLPEAQIGMGANFGSVVLPKRVPMGIAMEMLLTGDYVSSEFAERWGLVNRIVEPADVLPAALQLAERIAANAPISVRRMKETAVKGLELPLWQALRLDVGPNPYLSEDRAEGIAAYLEKRPPRWTGRCASGGDRRQVQVDAEEQGRPQHDRDDQRQDLRDPRDAVVSVGQGHDDTDRQVDQAEQRDAHGSLLVTAAAPSCGPPEVNPSDLAVPWGATPGSGHRPQVLAEPGRAPREPSSDSGAVQAPEKRSSSRCTSGGPGMTAFGVPYRRGRYGRPPVGHNGDVGSGGTMPRTSAGILLHRVGTGGREVLIGHMGGPFWARKDAGGWSIPKGEYEPGEDAFAVACREFEEELGTPVPAADFLPLGELRTTSSKVLTVWAAAGDLDASASVSNTFELEWPPRSGRVQEFPEINRAAWFEVEEARAKLVKGQVGFLDRLLERLPPE